MGSPEATGCIVEAPVEARRIAPAELARRALLSGGQIGTAAAPRLSAEDPAALNSAIAATNKVIATRINVRDNANGATPGTDGTLVGLNNSGLRGNR